MARYVICPFFQYERAAIESKRFPICVGCEGVENPMRFPSRKHVNKVMEKFCATFDYKECKHAQRAQAKYEKRGMLT